MSDPKPPVVLLHGFLGDHTVWKDFSRELSKTYRVLAPDLPGHGKSPVLAEVHSMELMADAIAQYLNRNEVERAFFVGHSMGGYVALALAKKYPKRVKGICLLNSTALADTPQRQADRLRAVRVVEANPALFIREAIPALYYPKNHERIARRIMRYKKIALATSKEGAIAAILGMKDRKDRTALIRSGKFPVLYLAGEHDQSVTVESIIDQTRDTSAEVHVFPDCAHMGFDEAPGACLKVLSGFLEVYHRNTSQAHPTKKAEPKSRLY